MSKTFRDYYEKENWGKGQRGKSHKQKRKTAKEYLRQMEEEDDYNLGYGDNGYEDPYWDDIDSKFSELD